MMSDYFGALMRSSGLTAGGSAPAAVAPPTTASRPVEIDIERSGPALQPRPAPASQYEAPLTTIAAASVEPRSGHEPAPPAARPADPGEQAAAAVDSPHDQTGQKAEVFSGAQPLVPPFSPADPSTPAAQPLGHALVRAAMQWVAADPQQAIPEPQDGARREPPAALGEPGMPVTTTPTPIADAEPQTLPARARHSVASSIEAVEDAPRRTTLATLPTLPTLPATPAPVAPTSLPRDELVEISIGAIHVRVDAPAAQTVARTLAPPAAAPRSTAPTTTPRSALARRALRRI